MVKIANNIIVSAIDCTSSAGAIITACTTIDSSVSSHPWTSAQFQSELGCANMQGVVAQTQQEDTVGFALGRNAADEFEVMKIAVAKPYQHRGIGTRLMQSLLDQAQRRGAIKSYCEVGCLNIAAQKLYKKIGFIPRYTREKYYTSNEAAVVLSCTLTGVL